MADTDTIFEFAEALIYDHSRTYCSDLQRTILMTVLQGERKTYEQLADECGYSAKYVKQDVAPKLWNLLSEAIGQKISKSNARNILEQECRKRSPTPPSEGSQISQAASPFQTSTSISNPAIATPTFPASGPPEISGASGAKALSIPGTITGKSTILLVDDQPKNLRLLSDVLEEEGYEVQQAINGLVALQAVAIALPDLILLDIHMPELDGYTVCQQLKANPRTQDIPVIFVSALDEAWDKVKAFSVGGVDYITKPFKVVEVLARVENQLKIQQLQQELKAQNAHLRQAIQELSRLAAIDSVTQLASRKRFEEYLRSMWQQSIFEKTPLTLMMCQIDGLTVDDLSETNGGETCLYQVGRMIRQEVQRSEDFVGRYEATTFAIASPNLTGEQAKTIAEQLLDKLEDLAIALPHSAQSKTTQQNIRPQNTRSQDTGSQSRTTLSIGIASQIPNETDPLPDLIEACDRALKQATQEGGNCCVAGP